MTDIDLETAQALLDEGLAVIPTAGGAEKRPFASWKEYQGRLPTRDEVARWFAAPRPGGVVCGAVSGGVEVLDLDTPEAFEAFRERFGGKVPCERSPHGGHAWYRCDEIGRNARPAEKVDTRGEGGFCVTYEPQALLKSGVPRISPELRAEMFAFVAGGGKDAGSGKAGESGESGKAAGQKPGSIWAVLQAAGWKAGPERNGWVPIANGSKTAAISANGENIKMFSTTCWEAPAPEPVAPEVTPAKDLAAAHPEMPEAILPWCRRGSVALLAAAPKVGKTTLAIRAALKSSEAGRRVMYADLENGACLFAHRLRRYGGGKPVPDGLLYLDCTERADIDYIAAGIEAAGGADLLVIDPWGLLIANSVEDESSNSLVSQFFIRMRRALKPFGCATLILHHLPKSGLDQPLNFAGAGASALQRYVQTIARIREDRNGNFWFEALCREFDDPFKPVLLRRASPK